MEPEGSLPQSQVPTTIPYSESARSSPYPSIPLPEDPSLYYPPVYAWVSQVVSFLQVSQPKPYIRFLSPPYALHARPISLSSILSPEQYWVRSTDHYTPHYVVLSTPCHLVPLRPKCSFQHPILKHPQPMFLPQCKRPSFTPI